MTATSPVDCAYRMGTNERKDFTRDWTPELINQDGVATDTISTVSWAIEPDDGIIMINNPFRLDPIVGIYVETPAAGQWYRLVCTVTTVGNRTYEAVIGIGGIKKSDN